MLNEQEQALQHNVGLLVTANRAVGAPVEMQNIALAYQVSVEQLLDTIKQLRAEAAGGKYANS